MSYEIYWKIIKLIEWWYDRIFNIYSAISWLGMRGMPRTNNKLRKLVDKAKKIEL